MTRGSSKSGKRAFLYKSRQKCKDYVKEGPKLLKQYNSKKKFFPRCSEKHPKKHLSVLNENT